MNSKAIEADPKRWSRIQELFDRALRLTADNRHAFLSDSCADDEELRDYVLRLLQSDSSIDATIDRTIVETMSQAFSDDEAEAEKIRGEMLGPYRIGRILGSGGMGMVYLAERADEQFEQLVAIKLGRHRLVDPQTEQRLRHERQILADLDHPNIARLFDGGTTKEGVPYLVMEFIDGVRIDEYCDSHQLSVQERLQLFQTVCSAVHYAHQNLIIHRDIKAPNILVTDDGTPKLLDFGIAKLTDTTGAATKGLTREGAVIMTLANATPEQVLGRNVTTATDVYTLGLLLHHLLSGFRAYEVDDLTPSELARIICYQKVTKPSSRIAQERRAAKGSQRLDAGSGLDEISAGRITSLDRLQRRLRGDLDMIVLNALRKEPERRYHSVSALADDINLHLKSMPIIARADSWRYRSGKFMRRHYVAVTASLLVVAMLASFTLLLSVQNRQIARERDTAREVSKFLEDIFMAQDPAQARGTRITADEILAAGADRIRSDLGGRPDIQSALMGTIGRVYYNLGEYQPSVEMLEKALELRQETDGVDQANVAIAMNDLAETLIRRAEYDRSLDLLTQALRINKRVGREATPQLARNRFDLAEVYLATGNIDAAETSANASIDLYATLGDRYGIQYAEAKSALARILQVRGDLGRTETLLLEAIEIVTNTEGPNHPFLAYYLQNLGVLQRSKGDLEAAEKTLYEAVDTTRRILGEKHSLLAATLTDQGVVLHMKNNYADAEDVMREALSLQIEISGTDHPLVGYDLTLLGMLLHDKSDFTAAEDALRRALKIYAIVLDDDHQYTASALTELGAVLNSTGRLFEAQTVLERALAIRDKDYPSDHELVAVTRAELADTLSRQGHFDEAERMLQQSLATLGSRPGRRLERATEALQRLRELSRPDAAERR